MARGHSVKDSDPESDAQGQESDQSVSRDDFPYKNIEATQMDEGYMTKSDAEGEYMKDTQGYLEDVRQGYLDDVIATRTPSRGGSLENEALLLDIASASRNSKSFIEKFAKYSHILKTSSTETSTPVVQNIVASVHLGRELDLREIAISTRNAEYNPKKFNALVLRMHNPKCTGLIFRTGRIIITGSRTTEAARLGAKRMAKIIRRVLGGDDFAFRNFKIENIIATFNCNVPIRLEVLSSEHEDLCNYEPEFFAGLVFRFSLTDTSEAVLLIFVSGNVIITGCKSMEEVHHVFNTMHPILLRYQE
ncbi:transcription factor TFIID or TATA-binding protein, TBP, putative [Theileria equi strain WA]|uniref:Transcription factor TFIID or TATA-binding protein, TBP, putative n=1 Tax=Theileria equi strain WA TaxID=1537102 RepID=L1LA31_THEEQ|nr:transcription factor TFIID or TATA-binding protein, TBP, putative [Theileria equi strain WA]EKX72085.1 transcription factor TFIID or TATA-binding protein, TBP, putative [Theileria equi strain WA]|eukprot:XP_004831537.1 transcription factor TFIID or TATA-binding protein, TBP, putative [Theileria equi strain WA]